MDRPMSNRFPKAAQTRHTVAVLVGLVCLFSACAKPFLLRLDSPAGAKLIVRAGPFTPKRELPIPFTARFEPMGNLVPYSVIIEIPATLSKRCGGRGKPIQLFGRLYIYPATELTTGRTVALLLPVSRVRALVTGDLGEISHFVSDPNSARGESYLARLVLRTSSF